MPKLKRVIFLDGDDDKVAEVAKHLLHCNSFGTQVQMSLYTSSQVGAMYYARELPSSGKMNDSLLAPQDVRALHSLVLKQIMLSQTLADTIVVCHSAPIHLERIYQAKRQVYPQSIMYIDFANFDREIKKKDVQVYYISVNDREATNDFRDKWFCYDLDEPSLVAQQIWNYCLSGLKMYDERNPV